MSEPIRFKRNDFVRIGFGLLDHRRAEEAGAEAMCLWLWANMYSRKHLLSGWVPVSMLKKMLGYSPKNVASLVRYGLLVEARGDDGSDGYMIPHYSDWNQTREDVLASREKGKKKKQEQREAAKSKTMSRPTSPDVSPGDTGRDDKGDIGICPPGHANSLSDLPFSSSQQIGSTSPDAKRPPPAPPSGPSGGMTALPDDFALTDERRAYAETIGLTGVDEVFRKFPNVCREKGKTSADWDATWRSFCDRELAYQRRERDRRASGAQAVAEVSAAARYPEHRPAPVRRATREEAAASAAAALAAIQAPRGAANDAGDGSGEAASG
jgi:hypothetical protein